MIEGEALRTEARALFDLVDQDGSGAISPGELKMAAQALGIDVADTDLKRAFDGKAEVSFEAFHQLLGATDRSEGALLSFQEIASMFSACDSRRTGSLNRDDLIRCARDAGVATDDAGCAGFADECLSMFGERGELSAAGFAKALLLR